MRKDILRREFLKLKLKGYSYSYCKRIIAEEYEVSYSIRTLKRW